MQLQFATVTLVTLMLCSARILAWSMLAPPIATAGVPRVVKGMLAVALSLPMVTNAQANAPAPEFFPIVSSLLEQVLIGTALGFLTRLLFTAVESAGNMLDLFGGFSVAATYDPFTSAVNSVFGQFYTLLATTLLFVSDAHLVIFAGFFRTFSLLPLNATLNLHKVVAAFPNLVTGMIIAALQIAGPLIVVLFVCDISLGLLNRIAPQLNAFQLSFPVKVGLTLTLVGLGFTLMPNTIESLTSHVTDTLGQVL